MRAGAACHIGEEIPQVQLAHGSDGIRLVQGDAVHDGNASAVQKVRE
jgi:hypothetical protein